MNICTFSHTGILISVGLYTKDLNIRAVTRVSKIIIFRSHYISKYFNIYVKQTVFVSYLYNERLYSHKSYFKI